MTHRSGFACFVGRPNAGKSTLTNAIVGEKIAIASSKPQTTRHTVRGIITRPDSQLILVDTPGLHRPRTLLGERLNSLVRDTWSEVDVVAVCLPANQHVGPGDMCIVNEIRSPRQAAEVRRACHEDRPHQQGTPPQAPAGTHRDIEEAAGIRWEHRARLRGDRRRSTLVCDLLCRSCPKGPELYPHDIVTDEPPETRIAELIRSVLEVRDERTRSPWSSTRWACVRASADKPLMNVFASMIVERDSRRASSSATRGAAQGDGLRSPGRQIATCAARHTRPPRHAHQGRYKVAARRQARTQQIWASKGCGSPS